MCDMYVSIIVPTYKKFDSLNENISSIISQSYKSYEVIITDDGSPNFDERIIEDMIPKEFFSRFQIRRNFENCGTVKNFNNALKIARGEIIVGLAQDDSFACTDALEKIVCTFSETGCDWCTAKRIGKNSKKIYPNDDDFFLLSADPGKLYNRLCYMNFISGSCTYFKKSILAELDLFDESYYLLEDYPAILKLLQKRKKLCSIDAVIVNYGEDGVTSSNHTNKDIRNVLRKDNVRNYHENIEQYIADMPKKYRRYIEFKHLRNSIKDSILQRIMFYLKYIDVIPLALRIKRKCEMLVDSEQKDCEAYKLLQICMNGRKNRCKS